jgi:hypothetical protein
LDLALSHSPPRTDSDHSRTEVPEATIDETGSAYSDSNRSDTTDDSQLEEEEEEKEEEEEEEEEEDGPSLDPNDPLRGLEGLDDSGSDPCWGEAALEHPFPG